MGKKTEEWHRGYTDYLDGADLSDNPYSAGSKSFGQWKQGYLSCEKEYTTPKRDFGGLHYEDEDDE